MHSVYDKNGYKLRTVPEESKRAGYPSMVAGLSLMWMVMWCEVVGLCKSVVRLLFVGGFLSVSIRGYCSTTDHVHLFHFHLLPPAPQSQPNQLLQLQ